MNSIEMLRENATIASDAQAGAFTQEDFALIDQIKDKINHSLKVGCTGCGYCMPCPKGGDIPSIFRCYNHIYTENKGSGIKEYFQTVAIRKQPADASRCVECGKCEQHCPQHIEIRKVLKQADRELRPWFIRIFQPIARKFTLR